MFPIKVLSKQALIAALYTVLTVSGLGVSYGILQFRYSEILMWLCFLDPKNILGICVGCLVSNIFSPFGIIDMFVGTAGSLFAGLLMAKSKSKWLASIWPAFFSFLYAGEALFLGEINLQLFLPVTLQIMLSEFIIVAIIGIPVFTLFLKNKKFEQIVIDQEHLPTKETWAKISPLPF